jgi:hypothetical protein
MRYDNSVGDCPTDICEHFADLFESVYNVDTWDSDTEVVSGPSDGCGFSSIWLRMSDVEAAMSGLDAKKGPGNYGVPASFVKLHADGLKSPLFKFITLYWHFSIEMERFLPYFLFQRPVNVMMLVKFNGVIRLFDFILTRYQFVNRPIG